jgi:1-acyl-sn-glycerol-3-phosphate acyltransferase
MIYLRSALFALAFYTTTALMMVVFCPLLLAPRNWAMWALKLHARICLLYLRAIVGLHLEVRGLHNIPPGAVLVASKHQSAWETFALFPLFADPAMVMKAELGWIPMYGHFARKFGHILVAREKAAVALRGMIADALDRASQGRQIIIFPEGTRRAPDDPPDYKSGVVALYEGLSLPCVPVALNSGMFWPRRQWLRYPGTIVVEFLEPLPAGLDRRAFREQLQSSIEVTTKRLNMEARAKPVDISLPQTIAEHNKNI